MLYLFVFIATLLGSLVGNFIFWYVLKTDDFDKVKQKTKEIVYDKPKGHIFEPPPKTSEDIKNLVDEINKYE